MTHNALTEVPTVFGAVAIVSLSTRNILPNTSYGRKRLFRNLYLNNLFPPWNAQALFFLDFSWCDTILHRKLLVPKWITWYFLLGNTFEASLSGVTVFSVISFSSPELPTPSDWASGWNNMWKSWTRAVPVCTANSNPAAADHISASPLKPVLYPLLSVFCNLQLFQIKHSLSKW